MKFVNRDEEQKRLIDALNGEDSSFVVVYGRRRLGKSTLIKAVLTAYDVYYIIESY
jgi:AAA+ ATPase superfamily predicted ATPase